MQHAQKFGLGFLKLLAFSLGIFLFINLFRGVDIDKIYTLISHIGIAILLIPLPYVVTSIFDTLGWKAVFPTLERDVPFLQLFGIKLISEAMLMSLPGGTALAESIKPYLMKKRCGVPVSESIPLGVARNCLLSIGHSVYIVLSVIVGYAALSSISSKIIGIGGLPWLMLLASLVVMMGFGGVGAAFLYGSIAERLHRVFLRVPITRLREWLIKEEQRILDIDKQFSRFQNIERRHVVTSALFYISAWFFESVETFLIMKLLGIELGFIEILTLESALSFVRSMFVFLPAGIGIQDMGYVLFLGAFGVPDAPTVGAAFVLMKRAKEVFWILIGYALLLFSGVKPKEAFVQPS